MDEQIKEIVADVFDVDEAKVTDALTPDDVDDWDSLNHLKMVTMIEQAFKIKWSMTEIESIDSVGRLKQLVEQHQASA